MIIRIILALLIFNILLNMLSCGRVFTVF